ncbi:MAG: hypothetical protein AB7H97_00715 [Pseudobdellovibrionaceae bacterium]
MKVGQSRIIKNSRHKIREEIENELVDDFWVSYDEMFPFAVHSSNQKVSFEPGQIWSNSKTKLTIEKEWDKFFFIKDQHGDRKKISKENLSKTIREGKYKLISSRKFETLMQTLNFLLVPYLGPFLGQTLVHVIRKFIKSRGVK